MASVDNWTLDANRTRRAIKFSKNCLATKRDRAIDLSCRACGAGAWALGLDSRLGAALFSQPPTEENSDRLEPKQVNSDCGYGAGSSKIGPRITK